MPDRLRFFARVNPPTPLFDAIDDQTEIPFVPLEAVWPDRLDVSRRLPKAELKSGYTRFAKDDLLVPKITPTFEADRTVIASELPGGVGAATTEVHIVRVGRWIDRRYVRYLFSTKTFLSEGEAAMTGVAGQKRVPDEFLRDVVVPITDLKEQRAVAEFLDRETTRIDSLMGAKRKMIAALDARWHATMQTGVSGRLSHSDFKVTTIPWLPSIPKDWNEVKLNLVARLGSGHTPSRGHPEWWIDPSIPWITTGEVAQMRSDRVEYITETREMISRLGMANSSASLHPAKTVVLCRTASAGYSAIMGRDMATSQDFATWTCGPRLLPRFLLLCLRAMREDLLGRLAMGSTHQTIYMPDIESIKVPLPGIDDQALVIESVYKVLPSIDGAVSALGRQVELLREHRQALITSAVAGELAVPEAAA